MTAEVRRFLIFALIGLVNTTVHLLVFTVLFRACEMPMLAASAVGYGVGVMNSFFMNRVWTFNSRDRVTVRALFVFASVNVASLILNLKILGYLVGRGAVAELAQLLAITAAVFVNFLGVRFFVFRPTNKSGG